MLVESKYHSRSVSGRKRPSLGMLLLAIGVVTAFVLIFVKLAAPAEDSAGSGSDIPDSGTDPAVVSGNTPEPEVSPTDTPAPTTGPTSAPTATATKKPTPSPAPTGTGMSREALLGGNLVLVSNSVLWDFPTLKRVTLSDYSSDCYGLSNNSHTLQRQAFTALDRMLTDFSKQTGRTDLVVISSYRTMALQQTLWDRSMKNKGPEHTEKYIAKPGGSEHHTGLAVDLGVKTPGGKNEYFEGEYADPWIYEHMTEYGFVLRYREEKKDVTGIEPESWHFRYVGLPHAPIMEQKKLCLEEYLEYLRKFTPEAPLQGTCEGKTYRIWYTSASQPVLPETGTYDLSGDNMGGCIITLWA